MARIDGVMTKKDVKGNITHVTLNLKKHPEALKVLKEIGLIEKTTLEEDLENCITVDELRQILINHIDALPWQKL